MPGRSSTSREADYSLDAGRGRGGADRPDARARARAPLRPAGRHARARRARAQRRTSRSSRTRARRTARARRRSAPGTARRRRPSASIRARTSARWATPARSSPTTPSSPRSVRALREHGQREKYLHELEGYTARLDTIQALVLSHKLPLLDGWNEQRRQIAARVLRPSSQGVGDLVLPPVADGQRAGLAPLRRPHGRPGGARGLPRRARDRHRPALPGAGPPVGRLRAASATAQGAFPVAERLARECLSLPIFPGMTRGAGRGRGRRGRGVLPMADGRPTTRRTGSSTTSSSARTSSSTRSRTSTAAGSATTRAIGTFVEIQRGAVDRRALQDPEPHVHLRRRHDRGRGVRRPRRHVRQRQAAARDDCRRRAADAQTTGSCCTTRRRAPRVDRLGCVDPRRGADRRGRARRRRRGRDARRRSRAPSSWARPRDRSARQERASVLARESGREARHPKLWTKSVSSAAPRATRCEPICGGTGAGNDEPLRCTER